MTSLVFVLPAPIAINSSAIGCKVNCETRSGISLSIQFPSADMHSPFQQDWHFENQCDVKVRPIGQVLKLSNSRIEEALVFAVLVSTIEEEPSAPEQVQRLISELELSFKNLQSIFEVDFLQVRDAGFDVVAKRSTQTTFQMLVDSSSSSTREPESHLKMDVAVHANHFIKGEAVDVSDLIPAIRDAFGRMRSFLYWRFCLSQARKSFLMADFSLSSYWSAHALESAVRGPTTHIGEGLGTGRNFRTLLQDITDLDLIDQQEATAINKLRNDIVHNAIRPTALEAENFHKRCHDLIQKFLRARA